MHPREHAVTASVVVGQDCGCAVVVRGVARAGEGERRRGEREVIEDAARDLGLGDRSEHAARSTATIAHQNVMAERSAVKCGPVDPRAICEEQPPEQARDVRVGQPLVVRNVFATALCSAAGR